MASPPPPPPPPSSSYTEEETAAALLEWVNTFTSISPRLPLTTLAQLHDGFVLADLLHDIAPLRFPSTLLSLLPQNTSAIKWATAISNLKRLLKALESHYEEDLHLHMGAENSSPYFASLDLPACSKEKRVSELIKLVELVLFAAVRAPEQEKSREYVTKIMGLSDEAQGVLMASIEATKQQCTSSSSSSAASSTAAALTQDELNNDLSSSTSSITGGTHTHTHTTSHQHMHLAMEHLQKELTHERTEKQKALADAADLHTKLTHTTTLLQNTQSLLKQAEIDIHTHTQSLSAAHAHIDTLRTTCDQLKIKADEATADTDQYRLELENLKHAHTQTKTRAEKAEEGMRRLADEVDVLREKAQEVQNLEGTIEKYKQKLEQTATLKQHVKDLEAQNAKYLDQVLALEEEIKGTVPGLRKVVGEYKEKVLELEREKYVAVEGRELLGAEVGRMKEEVEGMAEARRFLMEECEGLKRDLGAAQAQLQEQQQHTHNTHHPPTHTHDGDNGAGNGGLGLFEDAADIREKLHRLDRENKQLKSQLAKAGPDGWPKVGSEEDILLLRSQLQDLKTVKEEREAETIKAKTRTQELEGHLQTLKATNEELEDEILRLKKEVTQAQTLTQTHTQTSSTLVATHEKTIAHLQAKLQENEATILTLKNEKDKLESYTRKTLQQVQDKYVQTLESLKKANVELKGRNRVLEERSIQDRAAQKREESLLKGMVFEFGMTLIEKENAVGGGKR